MRWLPIPAYLFANICLLVRKRRNWISEFVLDIIRHYSLFNSITNYFDACSTKIVLVLTEEREAQNILVIPGGELFYKNLEQFIDAVIRRAGKEELGITLYPERIEQFDIQIGYPTEGSPYEKEGIISVIASFICYITEEELNDITMNTVSIEGCDIVKIVVMPVPDVLEAIEKGEINVYDALMATLKKLNKRL